MLRRFLPVSALAALFCVGCVPVTDPVGDIDKAEPDKELLGTWDASGSEQWVIDVPDVKGNPKGLMRIRVVDGDKTKETMWFFTAVVGKRIYANLLIGGDGGKAFADLSAEGTYAKWAKGGGKYFVGLLTFKGDELTLDSGDKKAVEKLMENEKIAKAEFYKTGPGWLAKYLEKNGPAAIFDGSDTSKYTRAKKK